jgi:hypothetical protein
LRGREVTAAGRLGAGHPDLRAHHRRGLRLRENGQSNKARKAGRVNIETALKEAMTIDGALGVCLVDWDSGMSLGALGGGKYLDLDVAAAGNTEVIRAKMRTMESLRLDDSIEDILITLGKQYHLIRLLKNSRDEQGLFLYLVLERQKANLALARHSLKRIESDLSV